MKKVGGNVELNSFSLSKGVSVKTGDVVNKFSASKVKCGAGDVINEFSFSKSGKGVK